MKPFKLFIVIFIFIALVLNYRAAFAQASFWMKEGLLGMDMNENFNFEIPASDNKKTESPLYKDSADNKNRETINPEEGTAYLIIPKIGVKAPVVFTTSTSPDDIYDDLRNGLVHYADTPYPGQKGASIILGHSSAYPWYRGDYGSVFALIGKLDEGDEFYVTEGEKKLTYRISEKIVFNPFSKNENLDYVGDTRDSALILVSCWPVGTNYQRIAVKADLL